HLGTFAELGLIGGGLLTFAFAAHARALWQLRRAARQVGHDQAEDIALGLLAILATLLVAGSNGDLLLEKTPWLLLAVMQGASIAPGWGGAGGGGARSAQPSPVFPRPGGATPTAPRS